VEEKKWKCFAYKPIAQNCLILKIINNISIKISNMESNKISLYKLPSDLYLILYSYLDNKDLLSSSLISRRYLYAAQNFYRSLFHEKNYHLFTNDIPSEKAIKVEESEVVDEIFQKNQGKDFRIEYNLILSKKVFYVDNEFQFDPHNQEAAAEMCVKEISQLSHTAPSKLEFGGNLSVCLTSNGEMLLTISNDFKVAKWIKNPLIKEQVIQVSCGSKHLTFLTAESGSVYNLLYANEAVSDPIKIQEIEHRCKHVSSAFNHSFAVQEDNSTFSWCSDDLKPNKVSGLSGNIMQVSCGLNFALFLNSEHKVFQVEFEATYVGEMIVKQVVELGKKKIVQISCGYIHCFALYREDIPPISEWDTETLSNWMKENGYEDCCQLIMYRAIKGLDFANATDDFFLDVLGIRDTGLKQKLQFLINDKKKQTVGKSALYGWGSNIYGQLGIHGPSHLGRPTSIKLPKFKDSNDCIKKVDCGRRSTAILSQNGEVWMIGNKIVEKEKIEKGMEKVKNKKNTTQKERGGGNGKEPKTKKIKNSKTKSNKKGAKEGKVQEIEEKEEPHKGNKKRTKEDKIHEIEEKEESHKEEEKEKNLKHRWVECTDIFSQKSFGKNLLIEDIALGINKIAFICSYNYKNKDFNCKNSGVFKGADKIIRRLLFDIKTEKGDYVVGHEERFLGTLETGLLEYSESGIPYHRIQYFKKNGQIMWDRKNRINRF